jgi:hypothetical protein
MLLSRSDHEQKRKTYQHRQDAPDPHFAITHFGDSR